MAPPFLRRTSNLSCFFCLSAVTPAPADPRFFCCPRCGCWNRYDASGEILSDEPAMHDEKLNAPSFAKRASPNKDRLPSAYGKAPFCHTCQTNQSLLVNLLSNYLPPPQHPDYSKRLEQLPAYRESLHMRYPPVCASCLPSVEDEIEQKNQMARTKALGGWLKETKGKERQRFASGPAKHHGRLGFRLVVWRIRGALWWATQLCVVVAYAAAIRGCHFPHLLVRAIPVLPVLCLFSLAYISWDPTYYLFKTATVQGRDVRVQGRTRYIIVQALSWLSRFTTSIFLVLPSHTPLWDYLHTAAYPLSYRLSIYCSISLVVEILVFFSSFAILHQQRPPMIRLIETSTRSSMRNTPDPSVHSACATPVSTPLNDEPDLFASLTLSSKPLISASPMFGHPSLVYPASTSSTAQASPIKVDEDVDENAMDWTPTLPSPVKAKQADEDSGTWLRPQRFFPPERPTGLESLFANTKLDDGDAPRAKPSTPVLWNGKVAGWWVATITVILIPLGSVVYHTWMKDWIH